MALMALALSTLFIFNSDRAHYYAPLDSYTASNLAVAENLSPSANFALFTRLTFDEDGDPVYVPYSRFPIGGYALMKLVILPFGENAAAKIFAARMLMLAFLCAAAFLAYHAIARIASNQWVALTAVMIAFSSYYILRWGNRVTNEFTMDLCGVMLVFHGMVIFIQEKRFRQLAIKTCVALLLGWHVYGLLIPFIVLGIGNEVAQAFKSRRESSAGAWKTLAPIALRSRSIRLGGAAMLFGIAMLAFNFLSEYNALNGETPPTELPSVQSMFRRLGEGDAPYPFAWGAFAIDQFYRVTGATIPYALTGWRGLETEESLAGPPSWLAAVGALLVAASLAGLGLVRHCRIPLAALALSGLCWSLLARGHAYLPHHEHEAIYYVGVPLALVTIALVGLGKLRATRIPAVAAAVALPVFALSACQASVLSAETDRTVDRWEAIFADLAAIRKITQGSNVLVAERGSSIAHLQGGHHAASFLLSGSRIVSGAGRPYASAIASGNYDFVVLHQRDDAGPLLTPQNKLAFLYGPARPDDLRRSWLDSLLADASDDLAARAGYDVYVRDGALVYHKEPCAFEHANSIFVLRVIPEAPDDLPKDRRRHGYEDLTFLFPLWGVSFDGNCAARVPLPEYPISHIKTEQKTFGETLWSAEFPPNPAIHSAARRAALEGEPAIVDVFDVYLMEDALVYVKDPCDPMDVEDRFFLHIAPERWREGYVNLDFKFASRGIAFDGECAAKVPLPNYPIASARTGQFDSEGELWEAAFVVNPDAYRAAYESAASREPDARAAFDLHLDEEERTLLYVKEPCADSDVERPFFLHVTPERAEDLPTERREFGFDSGDFEFRLRGAAFDGKCAARAALPEYAISRVRTGQWVRGEGEVWESTIQFRE